MNNLLQSDMSVSKAVFLSTSKAAGLTLDENMFPHYYAAKYIMEHVTHVSTIEQACALMGILTPTVVDVLALSMFSIIEIMPIEFVKTMATNEPFHHMVQHILSASDTERVLALFMVEARLRYGP